MTGWIVEKMSSWGTRFSVIRFRCAIVRVSPTA